MKWFSTPGKPTKKLTETTHFLVLFGSSGLVLPTLDFALGRRDPPNWTWKNHDRLAGKITATAWFMLCLVSLHVVTLLRREEPLVIF